MHITALKLSITEFSLLSFLVLPAYSLFHNVHQNISGPHLFNLVTNVKVLGPNKLIFSRKTSFSFCSNFLLVQKTNFQIESCASYLPCPNTLKRNFTGIPSLSILCAPWLPYFCSTNRGTSLNSVQKTCQLLIIYVIPISIFHTWHNIF